MYIIILNFIQDGSWAIAKEDEQLIQLYHITKGHLSITYGKIKVSCGWIVQMDGQDGLIDEWMYRQTDKWTDELIQRDKWIDI